METLSKTKCIQAIRKEYGKRVNEKDIRKLADELDRIVTNRGTDETIEQAVLRGAEDIRERVEIGKRIEKRNAKIQQYKRARAMKYITETYSPERYREGIEDLMFGSDTDRGVRDGVEQKALGMENDVHSSLMSRLIREEVDHVFMNKHYDRAVARELEQVNSKNPAPAKDKSARKVAEIIKEQQDLMLHRLNKRGAWRGKLDGFITSQHHDPTLMFHYGKEQWIKDVETRLDHQKTFGGLSEAEKQDFLSNTYDALVSGIHLTYHGTKKADGTVDPAGSANATTSIARQVSEDRVLHFKNSDAWMDYFEKYSASPGLKESIMSNFERDARSAALMEVFGPNPEDNWQRIQRQLLERNRGNPRVVEKMKADFDRMGYLGRRWETITGNHLKVQHSSAAEWSSAARAISSMAYLGMSAISAFADTGFAAHRLNDMGVSPAHTMLQTLSSIADGTSLTSKERRLSIWMVGSALDGHLNHVAQRFTGQAQLSTNAGQKLAKLQHNFFKINFLSQWTDGMRAGVGRMIGSHLRSYSDTAWDALPRSLRHDMELHGITGDEWDVIRQARVDVDGDKMIAADMLDSLDDEAFHKLVRGKKITKRGIDDARDRVRLKLRQYVTDAIHEAVPKPGMREQAQLYWGFQRGTVMGEAMRFIMQFKQFPMTAWNKGMKRAMFRHTGAETYQEALTSQAAIGRVLGLVTATTVMGYIAMAAKDLSRGQTPPDITWNNVLAAGLQGGGLSIYGDFLFGEYSKYGRTALQTAAGPIPSEVLGTGSGLLSGALRGELEGRELVNFGLNNIPFQNLFYTQLMTDYLFTNSIKEYFSPGYMERTEQRLEEAGQQLLYEPR